MQAFAVVLLTACRALVGMDLIDEKTIGPRSPVERIAVVDGEISLILKARVNARLFPALPFGPDRNRDFAFLTSDAPYPHPPRIDKAIELRSKAFEAGDIITMPIGRDLKVFGRGRSLEVVHPKVQPLKQDGYATVYIVTILDTQCRIWVRHFPVEEPQP